MSTFTEKLKPPQADLQFPAPPAARATPLELACVTGLLAGLIGLQIYCADALYLFRRHFWVDELHTFAIVSDPDLGHSLRALANGVDGSPPCLHLLLRGFTRLTGGPGEVSHRGFALLMVLLALVGLYAGLRRAFTRLAAFTAVLAVWAHPLVLNNAAFEARYYAPWLAAVAWFAFFLARARDASSRLPNNLAVAVAAALLCTVHYFGVFTWALVVGFELLFHRPVRASRWLGLTAAASGPLALAASTPFYLGQRAAMNVPTWIDNPAPGWATVDALRAFLAAVLAPPFLVAVLLAFWLSAFTRRRRAAASEPAPPTPDLSVLAGLTGLVGLPLILILFSYAVQPTMVERYALPAVFVLALAVALAVARMSRPWALALCALFLVAGADTLQTKCRADRVTDADTDELITSIRDNTGDNPVVFESIHELFVVCRYAPDLADRCVMLDFEIGELPNTDGDKDRARGHNRDLGRRMAESYGKPRVLRWEEVKRLPKIYLVAEHDTYGERFAEPDRPYPGYKAEQLADQPLYRLDPK